MNIINNEQLLVVDIDETLILWQDLLYKESVKRALFQDPHDGKIKTVRIHEPNLKILTNHLSRGSAVIVWSRSGYKWAKAALECLGIDHINIYVATKPLGYLDDKPCQDWMGEHIYLPADSKWGL